MTTETTTSPAPVKRTRKTNPPPPPFDFTSVKPVKAAPVTRKNSANVVENPTKPWLVESWAEREGSLGAGKQVTIPTANVQQLKNLLNYAASDLKLGVSIRVEPVPAKRGEPARSVVHFSAKPRKQNRKVAAPATTTPTTTT